MTLSKSTLNLLVLSMVVAGLVGYSFTDAQTWAPPTVTPPGGNTAAPINVGSGAQTKVGDFTATNLTASNNANAQIVNAANYVWSPTLNTNTLNANVSANVPTVNTTNVWATNLLYGPNIQGGDIYSWWRVRSNAYCDQGGGNCIAPWNIQPKVTASCPADQAIAQIYADGNVRCVDVGGGGACASYTLKRCQVAPIQCPAGETQVGGKWNGSKCSASNDWQYVECRPNSC